MASILVVDDDDIVREVFKEFLEIDKHDVCLAESGDLAQEFAEKKQYDLIIVDIIMPGKEGLDTIKDLLSCQPNCKVIACTGKNYQDGYNSLRAAEVVGACGVLQKPFTLSDLQELLKSTLDA